MHSENEGKRGESAPRQLSGRGLAYWTDGRDDAHPLRDARLPADRARREDRRAGARLRQERRRRSEARDAIRRSISITGEIGLHAAPVIAGDVIIIGAAHLSGATPKSRANVKGYVRGFDVRTGKRLWIFHTIPKPGEFGNNTWEGDSARYTGNTGVVGADEPSTRSSGWCTCPSRCRPAITTAAIGPATTLFGESLVAVELKTGKRTWHYQLVHHGIWDFDIPCAADPRRPHGGRPADQGSRAAHQAGVGCMSSIASPGSRCGRSRSAPSRSPTCPGEKTSPTQPFVTKPPPFDRQGVSLDDLIDFTPALKAEAMKIVSRYKIGPLFTPPVVSNWDGPLGTIMLPSTGGRRELAGRSLRS